jgi:hypothetical protein
MDGISAFKVGATGAESETQRSVLFSIVTERPSGKFYP